MSAKRQIKLFLMHMETGQRYPLTEAEVVIGRYSGAILFPSDEKLSMQHCRVGLTNKGVVIQDLSSFHGTYVDGVRLDPTKLYLFKVGSVVKFGDQALKLITSDIKRKTPLRRKRKARPRRESDASLWISILILLVAITVFAYHLQRMQSSRLPRTPATIISPFEIVDKEVQAALEDYKRLGANFKQGKIREIDAVLAIRAELLPAFNSAQVRLSVVKPNSEYDRRRKELNQKLLVSLSAQLESFAKLVETKDQKYAKEMDAHAAESEKLRTQLSQLVR